MDTIKIGSSVFPGDIWPGDVSESGVRFETIEIRTPEAIPPDLLSQMMESGAVQMADGEEVRRYEGYRTVIRHSVFLGKQSQPEKELIAARTQLSELKETYLALQTVCNDLERENAALLYASLTGEAL